MVGKFLAVGMAVGFWSVGAMAEGDNERPNQPWHLQVSEREHVGEA